MIDQLAWSHAQRCERWQEPGKITRHNINTIRAWLGHVSINTTNIYAETDLETKAKALGMCAVDGKRSAKHWRDNHDLMAFLAQL